MKKSIRFALAALVFLQAPTWAQDDSAGATGKERRAESPPQVRREAVKRGGERTVDAGRGVERQDAGDRLGADEVAEVLEDLQRGMHALERLGRREELAALRGVAEQLRSRRRNAREGNRDREPRSAEREREFWRHQVEVMTVAVETLDSAGEGEQATLVRAAAEARRAMAAGHRPDQSAPRIQEVLEAMTTAARLARKAQRPERAQAIAEVVEVSRQRMRAYLERSGRDRPTGRRPAGEAERDAPRRPGEAPESPRAQRPRRPDVARDQAPPRRPGGPDRPAEAPPEDSKDRGQPKDVDRAEALIRARLEELERQISDLRRTLEEARRGVRDG